MPTIYFDGALIYKCTNQTTSAVFMHSSHIQFPGCLLFAEKQWRQGKPGGKGRGGHGGDKREANSRESRRRLSGKGLRRLGSKTAGFVTRAAQPVPDHFAAARGRLPSVPSTGSLAEVLTRPGLAGFREGFQTCFVIIRSVQPVPSLPSQRRKTSQAPFHLDLGLNHGLYLLLTSWRPGNRASIHMVAQERLWLRPAQIRRSTFQRGIGKSTHHNTRTTELCHLGISRCRSTRPSVMWIPPLGGAKLAAHCSVFAGGALSPEPRTSASAFRPNAR